MLHQGVHGVVDEAAVPASFGVPMVGMITDTTGSPATRGCTSFSPRTALGPTEPPPNVRSRCSGWTRAAASCAHGLASIVSAVDSLQARQW